MILRRDDEKFLKELKKVRRRIRTPRRWVKGSMETTWQVPKGYCLYGAIMKSPLCYNIERVVENIIEKKGWYGLIIFNDSEYTSHSEVLSVLDEAIEEYEGRIKNSIEKDRNGL